MPFYAMLNNEGKTTRKQTKQWEEGGEEGFLLEFGINGDGDGHACLAGHASLACPLSFPEEGGLLQLRLVLPCCEAARRKSAHTVLTDAKPQDMEHVQLCHTPHTRPCCSIVVLRVDDHGAGADRGGR